MKDALPPPRKSISSVFFCFDFAFSAIGRLVGDIPPERQSGMWFSHGLASVIFFADDEAAIDEIRNKYEPELRACEIWRVERGLVHQHKIWLNTPAQIPAALPRISSYSSLPPEQALILDELSSALNIAIEWSAQFMPENLEIFGRIIPPVNDILSELHFLFNPSLPAPSAFSEQAALQLRDNAIQREKLIHQRNGDLVQIAATLNAANFQAFSGAFPILSSSPSPIGTHSLLGIGSAYRALSKFSVFVETVFQKYPVAKVIKENFGVPGPVDIFPFLHGYDPQLWETDDVQKRGLLYGRWKDTSRGSQI
jgi:hypothetical protein